MSTYILIATVVLVILAFLFTLPGLIRKQKNDSSSLPSVSTYSNSSSEVSQTNKNNSNQTSTDTDTAKNPDNSSGSSDVETTLTTTTTPAPVTTVPLSNITENWALFLVNSDNLLPENYVPKTKVVYKGSKNYELDSRAAPMLIKMLEDAKNNGISLGVQSAYRSLTYQQGNFDRDVEKYMANGNSKEQAIELTSKNIQPPRQSEHCAALAIDFNTTENGKLFTLEENFEQTKAFKWLSENAASYGFILRYPKGKTSITGINYEPWHYRYVGTEHAEYINELGVTLEEYVERSEVAGLVTKPVA